MRWTALLASVALTACVTAAPVRVDRTLLTPADAATNLVAGGALTMGVTSAESSHGDDPLVRMTLSRADGRVLAFTAANHTPNDVMAQARGGPLAELMGFFGDETPTLYAADASKNSGAPYICAPNGPAYLGVYASPDGHVSVVGLKSGFEFEQTGSGTSSPLPFSPDLVCARLKFTRG